LRVLWWFRAQILNSHIPFAKAQGGFNRVCQARAHRQRVLVAFRLADDQAVHHCFDCVLLVAVQLNSVIQRIYFTVHASADKTRFVDFFQDCLIGTFAFAHHWRENEQAAAIRHCQDGIHNFLGGLALHGAAADRAVRNSNASE